MDPAEGIYSLCFDTRPGTNTDVDETIRLDYMTNLLSNMQCMGSPRYCLAAARADRLVSRRAVASDCSLA